MKLSTSSLLLSASLLFVACGGGGSADTASPANPPVTNPPPSGSDPSPDPGSPTPNNDPYVIDYYGDSTIWGWATNTSGARVARPAPQTFAERLPSQPQNEVRNEGVSGTTACDLLNGTDGVHPEWRAQMQASNATHVIVNHAINDQNPQFAQYGVEGYRSCLEDIARIAREEGKQVVFETPNPVADDDLATFVEAMRDVAGDQQPPVPVIDQYAYLTNYMAQEGVGLDAIVPDGTHPSQDTYDMKGRFAADRFMEIFPR